MAEKFSLKWNDFQNNISISFGTLKNEDYLQDVTLVTDDNNQISAHKLVLSACSDYFKSILKTNRASILLICLEGVNKSDIDNFLEYMYFGEVQLLQHDLDRFLNIAQRFKIKGLLSDNSNDKSDVEQELEPIRRETIYENQGKQENNMWNQDTWNQQTKPIKNLVALNQEANDDQVKSQIESHIERLEDGNVKCGICGKISTDKSRGNKILSMRAHIETHLDGISYTCSECGKVVRSKNSLRVHKSQFHGNKKFQ